MGGPFDTVTLSGHKNVSRYVQHTGGIWLARIRTERRREWRWRRRRLRRRRRRSCDGGAGDGGAGDGGSGEGGTGDGGGADGGGGKGGEGELVGGGGEASRAAEVVLNKRQWAEEGSGLTGPKVAGRLAGLVKGPGAVLAAAMSMGQKGSPTAAAVAAEAATTPPSALALVLVADLAPCSAC